MSQGLAEYRQATPTYRCDCGKVYAPTRDAAKQLRRSIANHNGNHNMCRYYSCEYGAWHWTANLTPTRKGH